MSRHARRRSATAWRRARASPRIVSVSRARNGCIGQVGILKPDIVFYGEAMPPSFHDTLEADLEKADLLLVLGTSLRVTPVSLMPSLVEPTCARVLLNRERLKAAVQSEFDAHVQVSQTPSWVLLRLVRGPRGNGQRAGAPRATGRLAAFASSELTCVHVFVLLP